MGEAPLHDVKMAESSSIGGAGSVEMRLDRALARAKGQGRPLAVVAGDLPLVRPLGWAGIPIAVVTTDASAPVLRSRYVDGHCLVQGYLPHQEADTVDAWLRMGERITKTLGQRAPLFYGRDGQLELLYRHRASLERHYLFTLNDDPLAWSLHDKGLFYPLCAAARIRVPATVVPSADVDLSLELGKLRPPLVVKPRTKSDWKAIQASLLEKDSKARVFASAAELLEHPSFRELAPRVVVQELIEGPVTALYSVHGFVTRDGHRLGSFCGRKLRTYPRVAGESAFVELVHDAEVETTGLDVVEKLGIRGPFKIDLIRDERSGELYTLEINARFNLWHHVGAANGVNVPLLAYQYLCFGLEPQQPTRYDVRTRWEDLYRDLQCLREDPDLSVPRWLASVLSANAVHDTFAWNDPMPFIAWIQKQVRARVARTT
jgi:predicted ATP-grasp superfamily ATP-dependent carboligase